MSTTGLEVGGTWIRALRLDDGGGVDDRVRRPTPGTAAEAAELLAALWREVGGGEAAAVGLAAAPELDAAGRVRRWGSRPDWRGADLLAPLAAAGAEVHVVDDVSAAALAEHWSGLPQDDAPLLPATSVTVAWGTGVGAGAVVEDRPWLGAHGRALDLGHLRVAAAGTRRCGCGETGCLQTVVAGRRFLDKAAELGVEPTDLAAADGGPEAEWVDAFLTPFADAVETVHRLFDPHVLHVGGGLGELLLPRLAARWRLDGAAPRPMRWGTWSGAVGAAMAAAARRGVRIRHPRPADEAARLTVALVQGPNLGALGQREPEHYGGETLDQLDARLSRLAAELGVGFVSVQSDHQGVLVEWLQRRRGRLDGAVVNPAGLTAHGYPLRDALTAGPTPFVEVHLSNIDAREDWHRQSCFADVAVGRVSGLRGDGYEAALRALVQHLRRSDPASG